MSRELVRPCLAAAVALAISVVQPDRSEASETSEVTGGAAGAG